MPQVVAGIVFFQLAQAPPDAAAGEHDFEPEHEVARDAVGKRLRAAGIGGEIAADGAASLGAERKRKQAVVGCGRFLRAREHDAGLADHRIAGGVHFADAIEPHRRNDDGAFVERNLPADEAGIAALRHDCGLRLLRELEDGGNLVGRSRLQHHGGAALVEVARLVQVGRHFARVADRMLRADDTREAFEHRFCGRGRGCGGFCSDRHG